MAAVTMTIKQQYGIDDNDNSDGCNGEGDKGNNDGRGNGNDNMHDRNKNGRCNAKELASWMEETTLTALAWQWW